VGSLAGGTLDGDGVVEGAVDIEVGTLWVWIGGVTGLFVSLSSGAKNQIKAIVTTTTATADPIAISTSRVFRGGR
jgi:hypothetical protein